MENFLSEEDYEFYEQLSSFYFSPDNIMLTNLGFEKEEPTHTNEINKITHIQKLNSLTQTKLTKKYPMLKYLDHEYYYEDINFSNYEKLEVLVVEFTFINDKQMLNLPNIKTLIIKQTSLDKCYRTVDTKQFNNLLITLNEIIFVNNSWKTTKI